MKTFKRFMHKYWFLTAISIVLMLFELTNELLQPYIMSKMIDEGILLNDYKVIIIWGAILIGSTAVAFIIGIISSFYSSYVSQHFGYDLRQGLYETVQRFSYAVFSRFQEAALMTRMTNDVTQVQNMVFMSTRIALRAPLLVLGSMIMAFIVNPYLAVFLLISLPFVVFFLAWAMIKNNKLFKLVQEKLDSVNRTIQQSLIGIRLIRIFVRSDYENKRFDQESKALKDRTIKTMRLAELTMPVVLVVVNFTILLVLWFGREAIQAGGSTSVGDVVAIVNYAMRITGALSMLGWIVMSISRAMASLSRIDEVFNATETYEQLEEMQTIQSIKGDVTFNQVSFQYPNTYTTTLSDISFHIKAGQMVALMGATGSGKTSILQLIPRMQEATAGQIIIDGKPISSFSLPELRQSIGYVPQEVLLFTGTVADNIRWGKNEATMDDIIAAAIMAQIHDTIMSLPDGYNTLIGQKGVNLSGGQKQRMSIARALVRKPKILLLDDCTSALDVQTENLLLGEIRKSSCTIFLVTQKMSSTVLADRILIIDDGQLIADGTHKQLLANSPLYQRICESQAYARRAHTWSNAIAEAPNV